MILLWNFSVKLGLFCGCLHNHLVNKVPPPFGLLVCKGVLLLVCKGVLSSFIVGVSRCFIGFYFWCVKVFYRVLLLVCQGVLLSFMNHDPPGKLTSLPTEAAVCLPVTAEGRVRSESIACWTLDARRSREQIHLRVNPFCPVRRILPMFHTHNSFIYHWC